SQPITSSFHGREAVEAYFRILGTSYQVLDFAALTLFVDGDKVLAAGSEVARLTLHAQIVRAEWVAVFEIEDELIKKVAMSIYRWTIFTGQSNICRPLGALAASSVKANN